MVTCAKCHVSTDDSKDFHRVVSISGGIMGDEYIESLYYCSKCDCYTVEVYRDRFDVQIPNLSEVLFQRTMVRRWSP
jgi:hypothetical protein